MMMAMPGNILGIGVDIEDIARFKKIKNKGLLKRIFTEKELGYCFSKARPEQHLAARFAAKEAAVKALGMLMIKMTGYADIEITNKRNGAPRIRINNKAMEKYNILLSMSHCEDKAVAFVFVHKISKFCANCK